MIVELPEWQPFAPDAIPWTPDASDSGRVVVLLAPAAARRDGWAVRLTLDLVGAWGDAGRKVVLADGVLEYPMLHREVGLPNDEGISDAALFGASVARVARPVPGRSFFFVSAGSPAGDPDAVATSPRWQRLRAGFKDAGVTLVLFLREGCAAQADLAAGADDVVVLAGSEQDVPEAARRMAGQVRLVLGPQSEPLAPPGAAPARADETAAPLAAPREVGGDLAPSSETDVPAWTPTDESPTDAHSAVPAAAILHGPGADVDGDGSPRDGDGIHADAFEGAPASGDATPEDVGGAPSPEEAPVPGYTPSRSRRNRGGEPGAGRKLLWIGLGVIVLVLIVVLGALRSG
ncbi:MAG: hypothetical protein WD995_12200 [Gemmatimonadota bacterium]